MSIDKTRGDNFMQKKGVCLFAAEVVEGTGKDQIPSGTENFLLALLPHDSVITNAYVHVVTASDAATSNVATLGTTDGGSEILTGVDLTTVGEQGTFAGQSLTTTGKPLYLNITTTGAATDVGKYVVVVEYVEYTKNTGEYTQVN